MSELVLMITFQDGKWGERISENRSKMTDRPLFILQYLVHNTDEDHKVSLNQLMDVCKASGHGGNRHKISNDIDILCRYGFDIICHKERFTVLGFFSRFLLTSYENM